MSLRELVFFLRVNLLYFCLTIFLGLSGAMLINNSSEIEFTAEAAIFIATPAALDAGAALASPSGNDAINGLAVGSSFSLQRVTSYASIIKQSETLESVIERLNLAYNVEELSRKISTSVVPETVLINIKVVDGDPKIAAEIANTVADEFAVTAQSLEISGIAALIGNQEPVKITTVQTASVPTIPTSPKKTRNYFLGIIAGLILALGIINLRGFFDRKVKNEKHLGNIPLIGTIRFDNQVSEHPILNRDEPYSERAESFRTLRTNIEYLRDGRKNLVLAITSSVPQEGKSTTCSNLAVSFADAGIRTLLIEGDMRRPSVGSYFSRSGEKIAEKGIGLSELLSRPMSFSRSSLGRFVHVLRDGKLSIILSGAIPPNPAELLSTSRIEKLIGYARKNYELTIVDCPPSLAVTDAGLIAKHADVVILVIFAGNTTIEQFEIAKRTFANIGLGFSGAILNKIPKISRKSAEYGYYYGSKHEHGGVYFTPEANNYDYYNNYGYADSKTQKEKADSRLLKLARKIREKRLRITAPKRNPRDLKPESSTFETLLKDLEKKNRK
jgi:capsular exopolysaccharide synthesis family protein